MAVKCAHCKQHHPTVADVRACAEGRQPSMPSPTCDGMGEGLKEPMHPASERSKNYLLALQDERILPPDYRIKERAELDMMEWPDVSTTIDLLKACQRKEHGDKLSGQKKWSMPEGRYALFTPGDDGVSYSYVDRQDLVPMRKSKWDFYEVNKPTSGRWAGYTFITMLVGAPGDYRKVKMSKERREAILDAIDKDPKQAMVDYGLQSGVCGRCHSPLTDPDSLARGLGPVCAGKTGWF